MLWMDLMFDTQVLTHRGTDELPESVLGSISDYYRRATTTSRPMSYLIAVVMLVLLGALGCRWAVSHDAIWRLAALTLLAGAPILLALARTVPNAVQLGGRAGSPAELSRLARSICRDHLLCLTCMCLFLAISLSAA